MDDGEVTLQEPRPHLGKEQKAGLLFVIICGAGAIVLGVFYVWHHMAVPFVVSYEGPRLFVGDDAVNAADERDKASDTDADGLSDYDEKRIYGTSPYLSDSDSDGLDDRTEVTAGTDPLCKEGGTCYVDGVTDPDAYVPSSTSGTFVGSFTEPTAPTPPSGVGGDMGLSPESPSLTAEDIERLKALPIAEVRALLINSGGDADKVNAMTDEEVQTLYLELLSSLSPQ